MVSASLLYLPGCLQDSLSALPLSCPLIPELQITDVTHCLWHFPQGSNLDLKASGTIAGDPSPQLLICSLRVLRPSLLSHT